MAKCMALLLSAVILLGAFPIPAFACTKAEVHQAIADWAGVPVGEVTDSTELDGLGGRSWPGDAPSLITEIELLCNCSIAPMVYQTFGYVVDIDEYVDVDDEEE